eukprot:GSA25T00013058001.1
MEANTKVKKSLVGWQQRIKDEEKAVLEDSSKPAEEKILEVFGFKLDFRDFPFVYVAETRDKAVDGVDKSRAAKTGVKVGDAVLQIQNERI